MTREIMEDVNNTLHQHKVQNFEKLLEDQSASLREDVSNSIKAHVSNFQGKIDNILRENQKIMKSRLPTFGEKGSQTEGWSMQDAIDEIDALKRRKWLAEKESKELSEKLAD